MPTAYSERRKSRNLFEAGKLRCPKDKQLRDILSYKRFELSKEFQNQLNVVLRCEFCGHLFSPHLKESEMSLIEGAFNAPEITDNQIPNDI